ncbi:MAG: 6-carboxytetrahydropterin synthase [Bacteroidia bacterium]
MVYITRREHFNAAHKVFNPNWDDEKNIEIFGKCANPNWHGHNYTLFVTVKGDPDKETGFVADLKQLSTIIKKYVVDVMDHKNVNLDVSFMKNKMATTENISIAIWEQLETPINKLGCKLHCVKLHETENNYVEYFGK